MNPITYYFKIPNDCKHREVILLDPMVATGGSAIAAIEKLKGLGIRKIKFMCLVAAPEGVENFSKACPDITIFAAALDDKLDEFGYILPGLGDAGDRLFGTK